MTPYRILIVDDSLFMRKLISDIVAEVPEFQVVDTAKNGKEALSKIKQHRPHAITLDIEMPEMDGLEALEVIMKDFPTPVIMLSSLTQEGADETIRALEMGAFDFVGKPSGSISLDIYKVKERLVDKLQAAVRANVKRTEVEEKIIPVITPQSTIVPKMVALPKEPISRPPVANSTDKVTEIPVTQIVAMGVSTGGPRALHKVLSEIPDNFPAPVLIVQHMPPNFTKSLAARLNSSSGLTVLEAEDGMLLTNGTAYVAPGGFHMKAVKKSGQLRIQITKEDPKSGHRPSVDMLFESLLPLGGIKKHIVLMTGMGSDGALGMLKLKKAGAETMIAESEETCVVYGMPRSAVELNAVTHILPGYSIAKKLIEVVRS